MGYADIIGDDEASKIEEFTRVDPVVEVNRFIAVEAFERVINIYILSPFVIPFAAPWSSVGFVHKC